MRGEADTPACVDPQAVFELWHIAPGFRRYASWEVTPAQWSAGGRHPFLLAKTKWRDHPIELERALFYELTGRGATEEANRMLVGQQHPNGQLQIERDSVP